MITVKNMLFAEQALFDQQSNRISVINVLEDTVVDSPTLFIPSLSVIAILDRSDQSDPTQIEL